MNKKTTGYFILAFGLLLVILSLAADLIGLGEGGAFGYKQIAGLAVGLGAALAGILLLRREA